MDPEESAEFPNAASVREEYRKLEAKLDAEEAILTRTDNSLLSEHVKKAGELYIASRRGGDSHQTARNSAIDSRVILKASRIGLAQSGNLNKCSPMEFLRALKCKFGNVTDDETLTQAEKDEQPAALDWVRFAAVAAQAINSVPAWDSPWEASKSELPEKEKKARERKQKDVLEAEVRPQGVAANDVNAVTEATQKKRCHAMRAALEKAEEELKAKKRQPGINFYSLVLNTDPEVGFSQTIENIFDFAFELKEGTVGLELRDGEPFVMTSRPPSQSEYQQGLAKVQNIVKLDHPTWLDLCKRYRDGGLIKTRKRSHAGCAAPSPDAPASKRAK